MLYLLPFCKVLPGTHKGLLGDVLGEFAITHTRKTMPKERIGILVVRDEKISFDLLVLASFGTHSYRRTVRTHITPYLTGERGRVKEKCTFLLFGAQPCPPKGAGSQKLAETPCACAQGVYSDPQGKRDCGVGMSQFTRAE